MNREQVKRGGITIKKLCLETAQGPVVLERQIPVQVKTRKIQFVLKKGTKTRLEIRLLRDKG
jgi:hypothetical protein